ncbi:MAG TPA: gamma-glutamyl-gamma-aminobutyrate hydrolase family protein [Isosphaeraceae bacterium]|jgi:putative glutamine amidotransferase|nr:gamma-glutamyl-gamma-aminobutyrate hydrolase family protein [Isosphaeraceae bacterium]
MTKDRPLIGINTDLFAAAKGRTLNSYVPCGYYDCILAAGGLPVILPPLTKEPDVAPILDRLDGVILTGGGDLDPKKMGLAPHPSVSVIPERRENADRLLCKLVQQRRLPTLGIGLGMQELNVCCGGGIYLHLPEDLPKSIPHRDPQGGVHRHTVVMQKGTRMEHIYGEGEIRVNSYHHQGIRKVAPNFRVGALAPDGLIEAIEGKDPSWWVVGVQWHPENEGNISLDTQLIEAFLEAAAASKGGRLTLAKAG